MRLGVAAVVESVGVRGVVSCSFVRSLLPQYIARRASLWKRKAREYGSAVLMLIVPDSTNTVLLWGLLILP